MKSIDEGKKESYNSMLISGGCNKEGKLPIKENLTILKQHAKKKRLNLHCGLVNSTEAGYISKVAETVSFDFVYDNEVIKEVYKIAKTKDDYVTSLKALQQQVKVVPHICIGLHGGKIHWEYTALSKLKEIGVDAISFIVFVPTKKYSYADCLPPDAKEVAHVLATARLMFPNTPLFLGCMRPRGSYRNELDSMAVQAGVNKLVIPAPKARKRAQQLGLSVTKGRECCGLD